MDEDVHRVNTVELHKQCGVAMTADNAEMSTPLPQWQEQWTHREGLRQNPTAPQLEMAITGCNAKRKRGLRQKKVQPGNGSGS